MKTSTHTNPLVLLLGWGGSTASQLQRYADWYADRGYPTKCYSFPTIKALRDPQWGRQQVQAWLQTLPRGPRIVHLFSNNGAITLALAMQYDAGFAESVLGLVMDSAPGLPDTMNPLQFARQFSRGFTPITAMLLKQPKCKDSRVLRLGWTAFFTVYTTLRPAVRKLTDRWHVMLRDTLPAETPLLFLYSSQDRVVLAQDIERFMGEMRARGYRVDGLRFDNSPHVTHAVHNTEAYYSKLATWLQSL